MKGYRTVIFNVLMMLSNIVGLMVLMDFAELGFTSIQAAWIILGLKVFSEFINILLRFYTTGPVGSDK